MIRINLLEETRVAAKKSGGGGLSMPSLDVAENVGVVVMLGGLGVAVAGVLAWWVVNNGTLGSLEKEIKKMEEEKKRLEYVLKKDEELKAKKKDLDNKIKLITELKEKQDHPVLMMQELSRNLAENVWFTDLRFTDDQLEVEGKALSKFMYSKFLDNLEKSRHFIDVRSGIVQERVQRSSRGKPAPSGGSDQVSFEMEAMFIADPEKYAREQAIKKEEAAKRAREAAAADAKGKKGRKKKR